MLLAMRRRLDGVASSSTGNQRFGAVGPLIAQFACSKKKSRRQLRMAIRSYALGVAVALTATSVAAPQKPSRHSAAQESVEARIDAIFEEWDSANSPGASVAVIEDQKST